MLRGTKIDSRFQADVKAKKLLFHTVARIQRRRETTAPEDRDDEKWDSIKKWINKILFLKDVLFFMLYREGAQVVGCPMQHAGSQFSD